MFLRGGIECVSFIIDVFKFLFTIIIQCDEVIKEDKSVGWKFVFVCVWYFNLDN